MATTLHGHGPPLTLTAPWHCQVCGYSNVGDLPCGMCGCRFPLAATVVARPAPAPIGLRQLPDLETRGRAGAAAPTPGRPATGRPAAERSAAGPAGGRASRTVVGVIIANLALQAFGLGLTVAAHLDPTRALELALAIALIFYGLTAVWVTVRSEALAVFARWLVGRPGEAVAIGLLSGAGGAVGLTLLFSALAGRPSVDPLAALLADEPVSLLLLGAVVLAALAPVIEELVFRGFLAEALREKGAPAAIAVSAVAFSIAHLRFSELQYYALMGVVLGVIYWKRGLVGSISAHAGFNGALVVIALVAAHGPASTVTTDGVTFRLPASWHATAVSGRVDYGAVGPGGAEVAVSHQPLPAGADLPPTVMANALASGAMALPRDLTIDPSSVQVVELPVGTVVSVHAVINGDGDDAILFTAGSNLVAVDMIANGSGPGARDLQKMLTTLHQTAAG